MTEDEARPLLAVLVAGFEHELEPETVAVYLHFIAELADLEVAGITMAELIRCETRFPTLATIRSYYSDEVRKHRLGQLPPAEEKGAPPPPEAIEMMKRLGVSFGEIP